MGNTKDMKPKRFKVVEGNDCFSLTMPWFRYSTLVLLLPVILFNSFILVLIAAWTGIIDFELKGFHPIAPILLFSAIIQPVTYYTIASLVNKTTVKVTNEKLTIKHHPIWFFGNVSWKCDEIKEVGIRFHSTSDRGGGGRGYYSVYVIGKFSIKRTIKSQICDHGTAMYIVKTLNEQLRSARDNENLEEASGKSHVNH
ncbi:hypothetical protein JD969_14785 [Planctomycetota bacterium]|nr:hypothetical protein JD969_14785 [Planctomycetota bacterium]